MPWGIDKESLSSSGHLRDYLNTVSKYNIHNSYELSNVVMVQSELKGESGIVQ